VGTERRIRAKQAMREPGGSTLYRTSYPHQVPRKGKFGRRVDSLCPPPYLWRCSLRRLKQGKSLYWIGIQLET